MYLTRASTANYTPQNERSSVQECAYVASAVRFKSLCVIILTSPACCCLAADRGRGIKVLQWVSEGGDSFSTASDLFEAMLILLCASHRVCVIQTLVAQYSRGIQIKVVIYVQCIGPLCDVRTIAELIFHSSLLGISFSQNIDLTNASSNIYPAGIPP